MQIKKLLCLGYGYTARALTRHLAGADVNITGTHRDPTKAAALRSDGVSPLHWTSDDAIAKSVSGHDAVLVSTPPDETGCPGLAATHSALAEAAKNISWIGYLSTNGVYGDHDGGWVDETSDLRPSSERSRRRVAAEEGWRAFADAWGLPLVIFRLPGIYGPGRSALDTVREGSAKRIVKPGQVFSRAHVDDIGAALAASMSAPSAGRLFNIADDEPSPPQDVIDFACKLLGVPPPPEISLDDASLSEMARSFYDDNKRVSNRRMKEALGVNLQYPTYREGLKAILDAETRV